MLCPHFALVIANPPPSRRILEQAIQWQGQHFADTHPHLVEDQHHRLHLLVKLTQMIEELIQDVVRNVARRPLRLGWKIVFKNDCFSRERRPPLTGLDIQNDAQIYDSAVPRTCRESLSCQEWEVLQHQRAIDFAGTKMWMLLLEKVREQRERPQHVPAVAF